MKDYLRFVGSTASAVCYRWWDEPYPHRQPVLDETVTTTIQATFMLEALRLHSCPRMEEVWHESIRQAAMWQVGESPKTVIKRTYKAIVDRKAQGLPVFVPNPNVWPHVSDVWEAIDEKNRIIEQLKTELSALKCAQ